RAVHARPRRRHAHHPSRRRDETRAREVRDLRPGIEAVVVALAGDSAVAELEKDGEARAQLLARLERAGLDPDGRDPAQLESDVVAVRDRGEHLEPFGAQQALAANARLLQRRQVAGRAVW